jgi:hypothetical protein
MSSLLTAPVLLQILVPLLDDVPEPEDVTPGWIYALVIIGLFAVTILLWFSMRKQLKKIRFDDGSSSDSDKQGPPAG